LSNHSSLFSSNSIMIG